MKEAMLYEKLDGQRVHCHLCAHECRIADGKLGVCQVRENSDGTLYTLVYGHTIGENVDPMEKKPLFHFHPGSTVYSIAAPGCNFRCRWCQNWQISQMPRERGLTGGREATPEEIVHSAQRTGCEGIAYTYTEPTIFFEYTYDISRLAQKRGLSNVYVTNGYMTSQMLDLFHPYLDAANVDLKAFKDETYRKFVGARLQPVLDSMKRMKALNIWLEITTLLIEGVNDDPAEIRDAARFVAQELGRDTPWHISRFFPAYEMADVPPTSMETLRRAREIGLGEGLRYVYVGNVAEGADTACPECGRTLIRRMGFGILENHITPQASCPYCGTRIAGVGLSREVPSTES